MAVNVCMTIYKSTMSTINPHALDGLPCDVILYLLKFLTLADLLVFAKVCVIARDLVRHEMRARHRRMLRRFVRNPDGLLSLLDRTHAIVSGSFALNYAQGEGCWSATDLDVYVNPRGLNEILDHLTSNEKYFIQFRPEATPPKMSKFEKRRM